MTTVVETGGLSKRYGRRWALRDCTLDVPAGKIVGLVGPNGAGKTTLLHLAVGLLTPTSGTISVLGRAPADDPAQLASTLIQRCVNQLRIRELLTYQPSGRHWPFHWFELTIFMGASVILASFCFWWIRRRIA